MRYKEIRKVSEYSWRILHDIDIVAPIGKAKSSLMSFSKDGNHGSFDIVDGRFEYTGTLPVSEAAKLLFENLVPLLDEYWIERSVTKIPHRQ